VQQELLRHDDLLSNALLLLRHTGIRISECADLSFDCLRFVGPGQWAIHVPLGKLKTERLVPVDPWSVNWSNASVRCGHPPRPRPVLSYCLGLAAATR
jgi:integrase